MTAAGSLQVEEAASGPKVESEGQSRAATIVSAVGGGVKGSQSGQGWSSQLLLCC